MASQPQKARADRIAKAEKWAAIRQELSHHILSVQDHIAVLVPVSMLTDMLLSGEIDQPYYLQRLEDMGWSYQDSRNQYQRVLEAFPQVQLPELPPFDGMMNVPPHRTSARKSRLSATRQARLAAHPSEG